MNLSQRLFKLQLCLTIAVLLLDAATWVLNGRIFPGAHTICLAVNQLYWFLSILPCYVGFLYCMTSSPACRPSRNSRFRPAGYKAAAAEIEYKIAQNHPMSILFFLNFQEAVFHAPDGPPGYFFHPA